MINFKNIIGNERLINYVTRSIKEKSDSHAYILLSEDKEMSKEIAYAISKAMMCEDFEKKDDACLECKSCMTFDSNNNPDFRIISIDQINAINKDSSTKSKTKIISVDHIRDMLLNEALYAPTNSKYKIFVIEDADLMTESAQNALLKTLEEPNEFVKIILLAAKESSLLQTIFSRCVTLKIMPLKSEEVKKWALTNLDPVKYSDELKNLDYYVRYASGSITKLKQALNDSDFEFYKNVAGEVAPLLLKCNFENFEKCKDILQQDDVKNNIETVLDILEIWYRDLAFASNNMLSDIINIDKKELIREQARRLDERRLEKAIYAIEKFKDDMKNHANYKIALEVFQINISEV
ncbi:MAG: hypothetical protein MJ244_04170 [Clostridia bacterium]|nr:hypothetical protein [Clostridia bacterium]